MGEGNDFFEVALTVAIALSVGSAGTSFGRKLPVTHSSCGTTQPHVLVDKVMQALAPREQEMSSSPKEQVET
jgi:hypothetical protein